MSEVLIWHWQSHNLLVVVNGIPNVHLLNTTPDLVFTLT